MIEERTRELYKPSSFFAFKALYIVSNIVYISINVLISNKVYTYISSVCIYK